MILVLLHQTNRVAKKTYFGKTVLYRVDVHTTHAPISLTRHTVQMSPHSLEGRGKKQTKLSPYIGQLTTA